MTTLAEVAARLAAAGVPTPALDAEWLVRHVTGWSRARVLTAGALEPTVAERLEPLVVRREAREPLQLILGTVGFRHLEIAVRPDVFVPRPETEVLAGETIDRLPAGGVVVEPCTGTGAVACAVATEGRTRVVATDLSAKAVALARENAAAVGADVEVLQGDLLTPVDPALRGRVDVLVCNPPYVAAGELVGLEPEIGWDPREAVVSGPTGFEMTDRLTAAGGAWLRPGGWLLLEVDSARAAETARRLAAAGLVDTGVVRDLAGRDRIVVGRRP